MTMLLKAVLPRESEIRIEMRKASFGGNRSEAGRYAANIRWQGQRGESKPSVNLSDDQLKAITKINKATEYVKSKGFTVEKFNGSDSKKLTEIRNAFDKQRKVLFQKKPKNYPSDDVPWSKWSQEEKDARTAYLRLSGGESMILKALQYTDTDFYVLRDKRGNIAALANADTSPIPSGETRMQINYMGSTQIVKGAGSALWGAMVKSHGKANGYSVGFDVADDALSFWSGMGAEIQSYGARIASASLFDVKDFAEVLK